MKKNFENIVKQFTRGMIVFDVSVCAALALGGVIHILQG